MANAVIMPKAGITVESCIIGTWEKKVGDTVKVGDVLFTYETDKASFECESTEEGELLAVFFEEGDEVPCMENVCAVGPHGEPTDCLQPGAAPMIVEEAQVEAAYAALTAVIADLKEKAPAAITATIAEIEAIVAMGDAKVSALIKALYDFFVGGYADTNEYEMLVAILGAIRKYIAAIVSAEIELTENTFYLAIVDGNDGYADIVAEALNLGADQYKKVTMAEVTAADIARADLITVAYNGEYAIDFAVAQAIAFAGEYVDGTLRASLNTYLAAAFADVLEPAAIAQISGVLNGTIDEVVATYLAGTVVELDWVGLVGEENLSYVAEAEGMIYDALVEAGTPDVLTYTFDVVDLLYSNADMLGIASTLAMIKPAFLYAQLGENAYYTVEIPVMDVLTLAANSALYGYVEYNANYYETMLTINAVNPDAVVAALGNYNRYDIDAEIVIGEVAFNIADTLAAFGYSEVALYELTAAFGTIASINAAAITNPMMKLTAMVAASLNTNVTVEEKNVEANDILELIAEVTTLYPLAFALEYDNVYFVDITDAKVGGEIYIAEQILAALTVKCDHTYTDCADATCNICGNERVPVGHSFTNYASNGDATCTADGTKTAICDNGCGVTDTIVDANTAIGHAYDNGVATTAPSCTDAGVMTYTCANCGDTYTKAIDATGHTVVTDKAVAPTCTATGLTEGSHCSVCNAVIVAQTTVAATGHDYNAGVVTTAPTCTTTGVKTFTCKNCNHSYTETIATVAHTAVTVPAVEATCTAIGYTAGSKCSVCNTVLVAQTVVAKKDHTVVTDAAVAPTCTTEGRTEGSHCSVCNTVIVAQTTVAATGHAYDNGVVTTAPTYTTEGVKTFTCANCGDTKTESIAMLEKVDEIVLTDGTKVTVPAGSTAILDPNTVISVNKITAEIAENVKNNIFTAIGGGNVSFGVLASFDISLLLNGATVQPGGMVAFTLPAPENTEGYDRFVVVYIDDNGNVTPCETTVNADGSITFLTDHFSMYSIIGIKDAPVVTPPVDTPAGSFGWIWIAAIAAAVVVAGAAVFFIIRRKRLG